MKERALPQKASLLTPTSQPPSPLPRPPGIRRFCLHTGQDSWVPLRKFLRLGPETIARLPREVGARLALAAGEGEDGGHCQGVPAGQGLFIPRSWPCPDQGPCHPPPEDSSSSTPATHHPAGLRTARQPGRWAAAGASQPQAACETCVDRSGPNPLSKQARLTPYERPQHTPTPTQVTTSTHTPSVSRGLKVGLHGEHRAELKILTKDSRSA